MKKTKEYAENDLDYYFSLESILFSNYDNVVKDDKITKFFSEFILNLCEIEKQICILTFFLLVFNEFLFFIFYLKYFQIFL
nr:hypothetical protein CcurKRNrm3_p154 [Cryptomonas curvata]